MMKSVAMRKTVAMKASGNQTPKISFVRKVAQTAGVAVSTLALTGTALAGGANVKLGADNGGLVFDPSTVTINKGDSVTWTNNAGFPHNIMFHEDDLNAPGEKASSTFDVAGAYSYYCEPHQGAGMQGKVIVQLLHVVRL